MGVARGGEGAWAARRMASGGGYRGDEPSLRFDIDYDDDAPPPPPDGERE